MRNLFGLLVFCSLALGHGESARTAVPASGGGTAFGVPHGGPGDPTSSRGGPVTITPKDGRAHRWDHWWAYNREWILAARIRGNPTTGIRAPGNDRLQRKKLREGELYDLMLHALEDKHHDVRAAAAVALGKFGMERAERPLSRHVNHPPEKWFDVRESAIYGIGLLGMEDYRKTMLNIAGDKLRSNKKRALALTSFLMDGTQESADLLVWHLKFFRSGIKTPATTEPVTAEQERRRFAAHLLGFVKLEGYDDILMNAADGARKWKGGEQGLAITALGRRRNKEYKEPLFRKLYERDLDRQARRSVPIALGMMIDRSNKDDVKRLARFIKDSKRDNVAQNFGVMALANIGGDQVIDILEGFLLNRTFNNDNDRSFVFLALGLIGKRSQKAKDILLREFGKARNTTTRSSLAMACGLAKVKEAIPMTIKMLDKTSLAAGSDSQPAPGAPAGGGRRAGRVGQPGGNRSGTRNTNLLGWGALALGLHGDKAAVPVVRKVFKKYSDAHVRESAAIALALLEKEGAVPELVEILRNAGTMHTKAAVVTALGVLPTPSRKAVDALKRAYKDDSLQNNVRAMAIIALGALGDPRAIPLSAYLVRNYNYFIRCAALDEIASLL